MARNLSWNTFFYLFSLISMRVCGILAKIFLARSITPYEYGLITLFVIALPGAMQNITNFCFFDILGHAKEGKKYLGFSLIYGTVAVAILAIIFFVFRSTIFTFLNIIPEYWEICYLVLFMVLFTVTIRAVLLGYLRGIRNHLFAAIFNAEPSILRVIFIVIALYLFAVYSFYVLFILFGLPPLVSLIPAVIYKFRAISSSLKSIVIPHKEIVIFGFSFFILNVYMGFTQQLNSVVISHDLGVTWQGYYDVSLSMVAVITFFSSAIYFVSAPETTVNNNRSEIFYKRGGFGDIGRMLFSMCLLSVIIIYFYSYQLTTLLFTENYAVASEYLIILAVGYAILFVQQYCAFLSVSADKKKGLSRILLITIISILIFPFFTHFMILYFKFMGAYLSITIFIICYTLATIFLIEDRTPLRLLFTKVDRLAYSFVGTFLVLYLLKFSLLPGIITSFVVFTLLIISLGYIEKDSILHIFRFKNK
jgi:O-antigen/teichoic acid export membrane protein